MSLKVLIAEDEEDLARQYQMALEALGHEVYLTTDGEECIKNYIYALTFNDENRPTPYDVVVIDYLMPIKDGITLAKEILKECPKQRIIFVTAHGPKLLPKLNDFEGQVEVLIKPVTLTNLIAKIENRRQKEIAKELYSKLKKWDPSDAHSVPTGPAHVAEKNRIFPN